jgi:hypothetical protein
MNGNINTYDFTGGSGAFFELGSSYKLNNLIVDFTSGIAAVIQRAFIYGYFSNPF